MLCESDCLMVYLTKRRPPAAAGVLQFGDLGEGVVAEINGLRPGLREQKAGIVEVASTDGV